MFCNNCGNPVEEGMVFCRNCGSLVSSEDATVVAEKKTFGKMLIIIGALAAIAVIVALICIFGGKKYEKVLLKCLDAGLKVKTKEYVAMCIPEDVLNGMCKELDLTKSEIYEITEQGLNVSKNNLEENNIKLSYKIKKSESLKRLNKLEDDVDNELGISDLDDFRDGMGEALGKYGLDEDKIRTAYAIDLRVTRNNESRNQICIVYKYEGKWYVFDVSLFNTILNSQAKESIKEKLEEFEDQLEIESIEIDGIDLNENFEEEQKEGLINPGALF